VINLHKLVYNNHIELEVLKDAVAEMKNADEDYDLLQELDEADLLFPQIEELDEADLLFPQIEELDEAETKNEPVQVVREMPRHLKNLIDECMARDIRAPKQVCVIFVLYTYFL
jgi:hypothetical protein